MNLDIVIPVVLIIAVMILLWRWYRSKMDDMKPAGETRPIPGARLTSERLHHLSSPPWRVVFEVGSHLGDVDHVVIGPTGVIAIQTVMTDRPDHDGIASHDPGRVASAAITRGDVDDITRRVGVPCSLLATVHWGTPLPDRPAADPVATGHVAVEGRRLEQWLIDRPPGPLTSEQVDRVWRSILVAIGRPDPLP